MNTTTKLPYTVTSEYGEQSFLSPEIARDYMNSLRGLGVTVKLNVNDIEPKVRKVNPAFVRQIHHHNHAFVYFIGYNDDSYEVTVAGTKSKGAGVVFSGRFDYYDFICKMAKGACSWKEAKNIAHAMIAIQEDVRYFAGQLHKDNHTDPWALTAQGWE